MPQTTKLFFYVFFILQIILTIVTLTNSAVIRREQRSITTNATVLGPPFEEVDPSTVTTQEDDGNLLLETPTLSKDGTATEKSMPDGTTAEVDEVQNEETTLTAGLRVDENTVGLSFDSQETAKQRSVDEEKEDDKVHETISTTSKSEEITTRLIDESSKTKLNETTVVRPFNENDKIPPKEEKEELSTVVLETTTQPTGEPEDTTKTFSSENQSTTKDEDVEKRITTAQYLAEIHEDITLDGSKIQDETTDVERGNSATELNETTISMHSAAAEEDKTNSVDSVTNAVTSHNLEDTVTNTSVKNVDKATETSIVHVQSEPTDTSTKLPDDEISTTFVTNEHKEASTNDNLDTTELIVTKEDEPVQRESTELTVSKEGESVHEMTDKTSNKPPEETTTILPTSTETLNELPIKTLPPGLKSDDDLRISTPSSTEKRGKFIAHNFSSFNELHLPNTSDVWALAGLRSAGKPKSAELQNSIETSEEKPTNNSMATKSLLDWTRVMETTHEMESKTTTVKNVEITDETTTEKLIQLETTETDKTERPNQENEVELPTTKVQSETTTASVLHLANKTEADRHLLETTTDKDEKPAETTLKLDTTDDNLSTNTDTIESTTISSLKALTNDEKALEENKVDGNNLEKETTLLPTTPTPTVPTTLSFNTDEVTIKSETINNLKVNGESFHEPNTGTTSFSTSTTTDFTTSIPFLTSTAATTKATTTVAMTDVTTATPPVTRNKDDEINESQNTVSTNIPTQTSSPASVTVESSTTITTTTTTTTTTTMPAVTFMAATTETQTEAPHTPALISHHTTMIQQSEEALNKTTEKYADNSSTQTFEAATRIALPEWSTNAAKISTTEVNKVDGVLDVTTASTFENNYAYDIESTKAVISTVTLAPKTNSAETATNGLQTATEDLDHIDPIHKISDTAETSIESNVIDPLQGGETSTAAATTTPTSTTTTTESSQENMRVHSTEGTAVDSIYSTTITATTTTTTTTTSNPIYDESATTLQSISTKKEDVYSIVPTIDNGGIRFHVPKLVLDDTTTLLPPGELGVGGVGGIGGGLQPMDTPDAQETDVNVIIAISVSTVGIIALILLVAFLYVMRKRQKQMSYGQRCRPVSLDAYSLDNVSVYNSVRRKGATLRASKRSYGNVAFDDPSLRHNVLGTHELARYVEKKSSIWEEFKEVPQIIARADEVPAGCEDKNRYANVIPLPETRVILQQQNGDEKTEYINANYVRGPKDTVNYYIACQAPLETTVTDFWRMIWEQNSRVIIMATDLIENGIDKCAEYLPPSVTLDNHTVFGDYQVTLKHREVKEKYAISTLMLKNTVNDESREITHYWYRWPETGVPTDEAPIIAMLLEARSSLKAYAIEQSDEKIETTMVDENKSSTNGEVNGNVTSEKAKTTAKDQGPLTIHCSPGTGRTGTILGCDIAMRCLEEPKRTVDVPQIVYSVRRGRASAVQTKEQYEFIYKVTHMYATKISNINNDN